MDNIHKEMAMGKWFKLSLCEQLGNVGSEVGRALKRHNEGNVELRNRAVDRALDLLDLTIADPRWKHRLKEILLGRHLLADLFYGKNEFNTKPEQIERYYTYFAIAARVGR